MDAAGNILLTMPASFLISGEYWITEAGGQGYAFAAAPYVELDIRKSRSAPGTDASHAQEICIISRWGSGSDAQKRTVLSAASTMESVSHPLLQAVGLEWNAGMPDYPLHELAELAPADIYIDSSRFFHLDGRKRGFASSAAVCAGLCKALNSLLPQQAQMSQRKLELLAIRAHRRFQGGNGSGYDILASLNGGAGLFTGGIEPQWESIPQLLNVIEPCWLLNAEKSVSTPSSITAFNSFRASNPETCRQLRAANNELHSSRHAFSSEEKFAAFLKSAANLGKELGECIGIPAVPAIAPLSLRQANQKSGQSCCVKTSGAGNETLLLFGWEETPAPPALFLSLEPPYSSTAAGYGSAPGKLLLFGEHAAVHGYPAVGTALPLRTEIRLYLHDADTDVSQRKGPQIHGLPPQYRKAALSVWQRLLELLPADTMIPADITLYIRSTVPFSSGFGSSASFSTALIRAVLQYTGSVVNETWVWETANKLEQEFHGSPSGIDTGLAIYGGCQGFSFSGTSAKKGLENRLPAIRKLNSPGLWILTAAIPRSRTTKELVQHIHQLKSSNPDSVRRELENLGACAGEFTRLIEKKSLDSIHAGKLADRAQCSLERLGVSTQDLDELLKFLKQEGACGAKLSGAGGGGAFYAVFPDREKMLQTAPKLQEKLIQSYGDQYANVYQLHI